MTTRPILGLALVALAITAPFTSATAQPAAAVGVGASLSAQELTALAAGAAAGSESPESEAAVRELATSGYFGALATGLSAASAKSLSGDELNLIARAALETREQSDRQAFETLVGSGFFQGPLLEALAAHAAGGPATTSRAESRPGDEGIHLAAAPPIQRKAPGLSADDLGKLAADAAAKNGHKRSVEAVIILRTSGFFGALAAVLNQQSGRTLTGPELQKLAAAAARDQDRASRKAFDALASRGFFGGPLREAVERAVKLALPPSTAWKEEALAGEADLIERSAKAVNELQKQAAGPGQSVLRGFHAKQHAAMLAELRVLPNLPAYARHGIFAEAKPYLAWVRFSNGQGKVHGDAAPDLRGCALKVLGAPEPMVTAGWQGPRTQDFLLTNNPVLPVRNASQYLDFQQVQLGEIGFLDALTNRFGWREARRIAKAMARNLAPPRSSADEFYWTGAPLAFGPYAAKLKLEPVPGSAAGQRHLRHPNYLREELRERLLKGEVRFILTAQFFADRDRTPIEDASVEWRESDAPLLQLAELVITVRDLESNRGRAENAFGNRLSFSPWHASAPLRPLGSLMRMRQAVYVASSGLRGHAKEPDGSEKFE